MPHTSDVTIMFTDVVGSTALLDRLGDEMGGRLMRRHFGMLRTATTRFGGREVKNLGDGLMIAFTEPVAAAACAAAMQRAAARHNGTNSESIEMRIGIHRGSAVRDGNDYFGKQVVIAKRLCDNCDGGQVLVSAVVRAALTDDTAPCNDRGALALHGISEPVAAAELDWQTTSELTLAGAA